MESHSQIKQVHVIFKTHLDMGFTAMAADAVKRYFEKIIPRPLIHGEGKGNRDLTGNSLISRGKRENHKNIFKTYLQCFEELLNYPSDFAG